MGPTINKDLKMCLISTTHQLVHGHYTLHIGQAVSCVNTTGQQARVISGYP